MNEKAQVTFTDEDGEQVTLEVIEQTTIMGVSYLLVLDSEDQETVYIMKADKAVNAQNDLDDSEGSDEISYVFVEDDTELNSVSKVFEELLEDTDIQSE